MKRLSRLEWGCLEIGPGPDQVTRAQADALLRAADAARVPLRVGKGEGERVILDGRHRLRMQQVVGVIAAHDVVLEILPKTTDDSATCRQNLITMIAAAGQFPVAAQQSAHLDSQSHDLLEVMILAFARDLVAALRPGIPRAYLRQSADLAALRGRLNLRQQFARLSGRADQLACDFDELLPDTALNRVLKAAALLLSRLAKSAAACRLLDEALMLFEGVSALPRGPLPDVSLDRMTRRFQDVYGLACLFLTNHYQGSRAGQRGGVALLFRMNLLFEAWIGQVLRRGLSGWTVRLQSQGAVRHALTRDEQPLFAMYPDILLQNGSRHIVMDTKWKRLTSAQTDPRRKVAQADVYQMLAYRQAWQAEAVVLIYPGESADCRLDRLTIPGAEVPLMLVETPISAPRRDGPALMECIAGLLM